MVEAAVSRGQEYRRHPVIGNRVACARWGPVSLATCQECIYLMRVEPAHDRTVQVLCALENGELELEFSW